MKLLYVPFILQGFAMFVDEFYFHERRGLPRWERWGHPLDTLSVLACLGLLLRGTTFMSYVWVCTLSCAFITKDEFVHARECQGIEHVLHAFLFLFHPLSFVAAWFLWKEQDILALKVQSAIVFVFMSYQIIRWSFPWKMQPR